MSLVVTDDKHYKAIADSIRNNPVTSPGKMKPEDMAKEVENAISGMYAFGYGEGEQSGYSEGFQHGYDDGFTVGEESGRAAGEVLAYDRFWDAYQQNGTLTNYERCFAGRGWTADTFKPKYNIVPVTTTHMFSASCLSNCDLDELAANAGITIDFSNATTFTEPFTWGNVAKVGTIDTRSASSLTAIFAYAHKLQTIRLLILKEDGSQTFGNNSFVSCNALVDLTIQGKIGTTGLNLQWSTKLSKASITSVVNALSATTSGLSITLSKTAVNNAFTTAEWSELAGTKSNWTINLV